MQRKLNLQKNTEKAYVLIRGQCSAVLQALIKGLSEYENHATSFDAIWLLTALKKATSGIDSKANAWLNMHDAIRNLYNMKQGSSEPKV